MKNAKVLSLFPILLALILSGCGGSRSRRGGLSSMSSQQSSTQQSGSSSTQQSESQSDSQVELDEQQARQRLARYNPETAVAPYSAVEITIYYQLIQATGAFDENSGALKDTTASVKQALESQTGTIREEEKDYLMSIVFEEDDLNMYMDMAETECKFYEYLTTGLIVEINMVQGDGSNIYFRNTGEGVHRYNFTTTTISHLKIYLLDDGRIEQTEATSLMKTRDSSSGGSYDGELEYGGTASVTWIRQ